VAAYPVNLDLAGRPVLVVGGGRVAAGKVAGLVEAGAAVTVVAPDVDERVAAVDGVRVERRRYVPGEVAGYRLAVTATGDPAVDQQVFDDGEAAGVWVNSADDPARCSFTLPARLRRGDLLVTVSTGGASPALAADEVGPEYEALLGLLADERRRLRATGASSEVPGWKAALESGMLDLVRGGDLVAARELLRTCLSSSSG
jgi:precorrin-2 dehydrogenase/sirohydrochlorin ferrochelatase